MLIGSLSRGRRGSAAVGRVRLPETAPRRLRWVRRCISSLPGQVEPLLRPLLNRDQRVLFVVVLLEHLPEALVVSSFLLELVLGE